MCCKVLHTFSSRTLLNAENKSHVGFVLPAHAWLTPHRSAWRRNGLNLFQVLLTKIISRRYISSVISDLFYLLTLMSYQLFQLPNAIIQNFKFVFFVNKGFLEFFLNFIINCNFTGFLSSVFPSFWLDVSYRNCSMLSLGLDLFLLNLPEVKLHLLFAEFSCIRTFFHFQSFIEFLENICDISIDLSPSNTLFCLFNFVSFICLLLCFILPVSPNKYAFYQHFIYYLIHF